MKLKDILGTIVKYREARKWTEYRLAEEAGLPQSTISSWYRKNLMPSIYSLEKICDALGITLSQLFAENDDYVTLTENQKLLLERFARLNSEQQNIILQLLSAM